MTALDAIVNGEVLERYDIVAMANASGATYRQLDSWVSAGLITPLPDSSKNPGSGRTRWFGADALQIVSLAAPLVQVGMKPATALATASALLVEQFATLGPFTIFLTQPTEDDA